jgi:hypothetical protein
LRQLAAIARVEEASIFERFQYPFTLVRFHHETAFARPRSAARRDKARVEVAAAFGGVAVHDDVADAHLVVTGLQPVEPEREAIDTHITLPTPRRAERGGQAVLHIGEDRGKAVVVRIGADAVRHADRAVEPLPAVQVDAVEAGVAAVPGEVDDDDDRRAAAAPELAVMLAVFRDRRGKEPGIQTLPRRIQPAIIAKADRPLGKGQRVAANLGTRRFDIDGLGDRTY